MTEEAGAEELGGQSSASTLELFFDLVFVFTITQLTHAFSIDPTWGVAGEVALIFSITWWMYSGFMWLTNEVAPSTTGRRTLLLIGMFGFFAIALAVPDAVSGRGLVFGWAFLGVTLLHAVMFRVAGGESSSRAILRILPVNLGAAILVLIGGYVHGAAAYVWWGAAVAVLLLLPAMSSADTGFIVRPSHYCERFGGVLIIAIGESIVGVGAGLTGLSMDARFFFEIGLGLSICYVMWWAFFGTDDEHGQLALERLPVASRNRPALVAYGYGAVPMLLGIVFTAAGLGMTIARAGDEATWAQATALSGGVALYMLGQTVFRSALGLPRPWMRLLAAAVALATIPIGVVSDVWLQMVGILVFVYATIIADDLLTFRSGEHGSYY
ncbi:low temperature requirement protein A [Gordonia neofelifaecis]|uniref:Low temperature requirement A n=1 Tax=Gordonia neofelifaecis NRRL B-59395 TaxID=644548 RepID=F1YPE3_9ACTN|nr:low temperature requirement protein A [Gordonia neofelifaecis]EGD53463.1 low temperature requirement A [Gordonia neofelifaecis NRRL B-59395]